MRQGDSGKGMVMDDHGHICVHCSDKPQESEHRISSLLPPPSHTPHCRLDHRLNRYANLQGVIIRDKAFRLLT